MKSIIKDIIIVVVIVLAITFFVKPILVKGISMESTLIENNYLCISKQAYNFGKPKYKDIVVFPHEEGEEKKLYIKRVIGLPGEKIAVKDGMVYKNGKVLDEPYTKDGVTSGEVPELTVAEGEIFVMGDNRLNSSDSRVFGPISIERVTGKAFVRLFPFNKIGLL